MTTTIRSDDPTGWTKVPHTLARDTRLSNGARGLAVQLLSHADGFRSDEQFLAQQSADSRNAVRAQLAELRKYGYLVRERTRGADGKLVTRSVLYDVPRQTELPVDPPPARGKPASRSDQGRFGKGDGEPLTAPWRDGATSGNAKNSQVRPSRQHPASRSDQAQREDGTPGPHATPRRDGPTSANTTNAQVTPTRHTPATQSDQHEHHIAAGRTDSPYPGAQIEDQGEDQKKISQSGEVHENRAPVASRDGLTDPPSRAHTQATERTARRNQCRRELHQAYGLNDTEADQAMAVCDLRSPTPIRSYVAYLRGMDADDRADIIEAIQKQTERRAALAEPAEPAPEPRRTAPDARPVAEATATPGMDATGCMDAPPPADPAAIAAEKAAAIADAKALMDQLKGQATAARLEPEPATAPTDLPVCTSPGCDVVLDPSGTCFICQPEPTRIPARTA